MQLRFSMEETKLLADILLNQGDPIGILDRAMAWDLRLDFDELEQLLEILTTTQLRARSEMEKSDDPDKRKALRARQLLLESMVEKVSEARAMI